ncbi:MAG: hypothetical protein IKO46_07820 [Salinivirgaceae bacterium]|nr:hypothetical protein [Salinivirgaceae bacterium]
MNRTLKILFFALLAMTSACTESVPGYVARHELERHQIKIAKILEISELETFTAADSLVICNNEYQKQKEQLIGIQQNFIDSLTVSIADAQSKAKSELDGAMKKAIAIGIRSMENKRSRALQIIDAYNNTPETTSLNAIISKIDRYKQMGDSVIGRAQRCTFVGRQGSLPEETFSRKYLLTADGQEIIGEIIEP